MSGDERPPLGGALDGLGDLGGWRTAAAAERRLRARCAGRRSRDRG
ncbi:hypothetical protein [Phytohabitans kaempferiae]|uniref:Uncharacterized protein n=1 Tax=Phytohabitans kaempferiae TaxID=1620943 RepID=A0ABV6MB49_9ACTN